MKRAFGVTTIYLYTRNHIKDVIKYIAKKKGLSMAKLIAEAVDFYIEHEIKNDRHLRERSAVIQYLKNRDQKK